jgi:hypothetical protein
MSRLSLDVLAVRAPGVTRRTLRSETRAEVEKLAASIERAVRRETSGAVRDLHVEVNGDGILLTGRCSTYYAKQMAQHAAMTVPAGGQLTNQIEVV